MNLVYMCVFYNTKYIRLLELLFLSLRFFSSQDFSILILTSSDFESKIQELLTKVGVRCKIHCIPCKSIFEAACSRLHVFEWPEIGLYEKILYLDTDIILRRDIAPLFSFDLEDKLYGIPSGTLKSPHFGGEFFDFTSIDPSTPGLNSGTMLFPSSAPIRELFSRILNHVNNYPAGKPPYALDQPFINYHAFTSGMSDTKLLEPHVSLYEDTMIVPNEDTASICHFSYPIGNFEHKYKRMSIFFKGLLHTIQEESQIDCMYEKQYTWGNGSIHFRKEGVDTTWGKGIARRVGSHRVIVEWNNFCHILQFNDDFTEYLSVRTSPMDFDCVVGKSSS